MVNKGDTILYEFGWKVVEAQVLKVYGNGYVKVIHKDFMWFLGLGYKHIIKTSEIIKVK